ncbi:lipopolysaccharide biosynthesis protein [Streptomyces diastatochromogenes]|nr:lipopolysaccharide biosynthesis protein [Streptomyces diastatochromogenes]
MSPSHEQHPPRALLPAGLRSPGRWAVLPAAVLAGAALGGGYGALKAPEYAATSYVIVVPAEKSDPSAVVGFAQAYGRVATDIAVTGDAQVWAGVSADTLRKNVQAATSPDAPMISITARSAKPSQAVSMADGVARALVLDSSHVAGNTGVKVVQFSRATKPVTPVSPRRRSPRSSAAARAASSAVWRSWSGRSGPPRATGPGTPGRRPSRPRPPRCPPRRSPRTSRRRCEPESPADRGLP